MYSRGKELLVWKKSVCPGCEFLSDCEQKVVNLETCHGEDQVGLAEDPIKALIIRSVRFMTAKPDKDRPYQSAAWLFDGKGSKNLRVIRTLPKPIPRIAVLLCSDREEYVNCRPSK